MVYHLFVTAITPKRNKREKKYWSIKNQTYNL